MDLYDYALSFFSDTHTNTSFGELHKLPRYLYHGTCKEYLPSILKNGLSPKTKYLINYPVHLTSDENEAYRYARICVEFLIHDKTGKWPEENETNLDKEAVVIEIDTSKIDSSFKSNVEWYTTTDIIPTIAFNRIIYY